MKIRCKTRNSVAIGLGNLADDGNRLPIGALTAVAHNLRRRISLCQ